MREGTRAEAEEPRFFEYGVGTQVMLSSASSQAMGILLSRARKLLDAAAVGELRERIKQVGKLTHFNPLTTEGAYMCIRSNPEFVINLKFNL